MLGNNSKSISFVLGRDAVYNLEACTARVSNYLVISSIKGEA
jgi:hypothetical protein